MYRYADYGYGSYLTYQYTVKFGNVSATAYCVQPSKPGPGTGTYTINKVGDVFFISPTCRTIFFTLSKLFSIFALKIYDSPYADCCNCACHQTFQLKAWTPILKSQGIIRKQNNKSVYHGAAPAILIQPCKFTCHIEHNHIWQIQQNLLRFLHIGRTYLESFEFLL